MLLSVVYVVVQRILQLIALLFRSAASKELEIVVLRHELAILRRQVHRPTFRPADRWFLAAASRLLPRVKWCSFLVTPTAASITASTGRPGASVRMLRRPLDRPHRHARQHTYVFFKQNVVMEYPRAQAVADGVNCDYEIWRICSTGAAVSGPTVVPQRMRP